MNLYINEIKQIMLITKKFECPENMKMHSIHLSVTQKQMNLINLIYK